MMSFLSEVFGCAHAHYSFPRTVRHGVRRSPAAAVTGTYVACLDCGKELPYDWNQMKVLSPRQVRQHEQQEAALVGARVAIK
jgi:hypothetical protein